MPTTTAPVSTKAYRDMDPGELATAIEANKKIFDEHFDLRFLRALNSEIVKHLKIYFRPEFVGFDEMPQRTNPERPLIYACNHSGMAFPWDAIIFGAGLFAKHDYKFERLFRALAAPMLSASNLMNPFILRDLWKRVGALDATGLNFETMMHYPDSNLLIYPEGVPGIGKGFNRKYQLQTFSTSMIRMAIKYKTAIIGVSCVNGEYINPFSYASRRLNKLVQKIGVPYLPVALQTPLLLLQPWLFYYALPAKLTYVRGRMHFPSEMVNGRNIEEVSLEEIREVRDKIQAAMQEELNEAVSQYGRRPYRWGEFLRNVGRHVRDLPFWTPIGWPALFTEFDRRYYSEPEPPKDIARGFLKFWRIAFRNPIVFAYFIPILGWIPIIRKGLKGRKVVDPWEGAEQ
ncbi:MAG: 1-acyl-sn-glycerol-3-phosphate acyltransferase [Bacteroidota bacterium]